MEVVEETVTAGRSGLNYDAAAGHHVYVWETLTSRKGQCRQSELILDDGSTHRATFQFR